MLGVVAGGVRLLPWLLDAEVPMDLSLMFGRVLVLGAVETGLLIGIPCGVAYGTYRCVALGEARALFALGVSPTRLLTSVLPLIAGAALCASLFGGLESAQRADPGALVQRLIDAAGRDCELTDGEAPGPGGQGAVRRIPGTGFSWLCQPDGSARLVRSLGDARRAWLAVDELRIVPDRGLATARGAEFLFVSSRFAPIADAPITDAPSGPDASGDAPSTLRLRAEEVTLRGLGLVSRALPSRDAEGLGWRSLALLLTSLVVTASVGAWVLVRRQPGLIGSLLPALASAAALRWLVSWIDARPGHGGYLALVVASAVVCAGLVAALYGATHRVVRTRDVGR